jgi:O-antigen biosynthesis protein
VPRPRPADLPSGHGAIIGYHGAIAPWIDFDLLDHLAAVRGDARLVLVGPVLGGAEAQAAALARRSNVTLIPERSPDEIAGYVQGFDVGLVPFLVDSMTEGVSPLKMYEYLAAGVPVVATPLPACVAEEMVVTAGDPECFAHAVADAIALRRAPSFAEGSAAAARAASWDRRVGLIRAALDERGILTVPS